MAAGRGVFWVSLLVSDITGAPWSDELLATLYDPGACVQGCKGFTGCSSGGKTFSSDISAFGSREESPVFRLPAHSLRVTSKRDWKYIIEAKIR